MPTFPDPTLTATQADLLGFYFNTLTAFSVMLVAGLIIYFELKYRRAKDDASGSFSAARPPRLEFTWVLVPLSLALFTFLGATRLYLWLIASR